MVDAVSRVNTFYIAPLYCSRPEGSDYGIGTFCPSSSSTHIASIRSYPS